MTMRGRSGCVGMTRKGYRLIESGCWTAAFFINLGGPSPCLCRNTSEDGPRYCRSLVESSCTVHTDLSSRPERSVVERSAVSLAHIVSEPDIQRPFSTISSTRSDMERISLSEALFSGPSMIRIAKTMDGRPREILRTRPSFPRKDAAPPPADRVRS